MFDAAEHKWYIEPNADGQARGPFSRETIEYLARCGTLEPNIHVREENEGWQEAKQVPFLSAAFTFWDSLGNVPDILRANATALVPPVPPDPATFGIEPGYFEKAVEGARQWESRRHLLSRPIRCVVVLAAIVIGIGACYVNSQRVTAQSLVLTGCLCLGAATILITIAEGTHDARLLRQFYNPKYNPRPDAYRHYALEYAKYETEVTMVYVSRRWIYHSRRYCCNMEYRRAMLKWEAVARHATPCSHCGHFSMRAKLLPKPFGNGVLPKA